MIAALYTVYIFCCIFLILVVLLQAGRGGGMALGGGSQQQAFGGGGAAPIMKNLTMGTAALWYHSDPLPGWWNWQTRRTKDPVA